MKKSLWKVTLFLLIVTESCDGQSVLMPINQAVLEGTKEIVMRCTSRGEVERLSWSYYPVAAPALVQLTDGHHVVPNATDLYGANVTGKNTNNLVVRSASEQTAGIYICRKYNDPYFIATALLIVIKSDPNCSITPSTPSELVYNQTVQMSCTFSYYANETYVSASMAWSMGPSTGDTASYRLTTSGMLTTITALLNTTYFSSFPGYSCTTSFKIYARYARDPMATNIPTYKHVWRSYSSPATTDSAGELSEGAKIGIGVGIGGALLISAIIIAVMLSRRARNRRRLEFGNTA